MATYRIPGVYFSEKTQSLGPTTTGYNRTAIIGIGRQWKSVLNLSLTKSIVSIDSDKILLSVVNSNKKTSTDTFALGDEVVWDSTTPSETGTIEIGVVNAHWIGDGTIQTGSYVQLQTSPSYGYIRVLAGTENALLVINNLTGNGYREAVEADTNKLTIIAPPVNTDYIYKTDGTKLLYTELVNVVRIGSLSGLADYIAGTDYTIIGSEGSGTVESPYGGYALINWLGTGNMPNNASIFYITYNMAKEADDYNPKIFFNSTDIQNEYGPEYADGVLQPISLASDLVLEGQTLVGGGVWCCQVNAISDDESVDPTVIAKYKEAIDKIMQYDIQTVIMLKQDNLSLRNYLIQNIATCSSSLYGKERTAFIVPNNNGLSPMDIIAQREGLMNDRITYFANKSVTVDVTDSVTQETESLELSSIYACANLSGIEGNPNYGYSEPMLRKALSSRITIDTYQKFDPTERNNLCAGYVSVFDINENTGLTYVFDIFTTNSTSVLTETRAVRRVTDLLRQTLRKSLAGFIGVKNLTSVPSEAANTVAFILSNFVSSQEINAYKGITASFNADNPKILEISFSYIPILEVKWVDVQIGINIA